jgi:hypothetical protein
MINPLKPKRQHPPEPPFGEHAVTSYEDAAALGRAFAGVPVPTPFELVRVDDPTGISGLGRMATGVIFPFEGGAAYRWQSPRPPVGWPQHVRQFGVFDSIAEVIAVHGHNGATILRTHDACDLDKSCLTAQVPTPEVFAIKDTSGDVPEWGVWYPHDDRAVTWAPPITPISGRHQAGRHTVWQSLEQLQERVDVRTGPGRGRLLWLTSHQGRALARQVRASFSSGVRHAEQAYERALNAPVLMFDPTVDPLVEAKLRARRNAGPPYFGPPAAATEPETTEPETAAP